ncbi:MAG: Omp28-related outer membrane protein [Bacteroidota bacterium]
MKKIFLPICIAIGSIVFAHAQDVSSTQAVMVTKKTATWCSFCGTWGWSLFDDMLEDSEGDALLIAAHHSGDLQNATSTEFVNNLKNQGGQPRFFLNRDDIGANNSNSASKRQQVKDAVSSSKNTTPIANSVLNNSLSGNELTISARAKFFQEATGDFYLSILVIEDDVVANQSSRGVVPHHKILRGAAQSGTFGKQLTNGTVAVNTEFTESFTVSLDDNWNKEKLEIAAVIWRKDGNTFEFVNAFLTSELNTTITSTTELGQSWGVQLQSRLSANEANLQIDLPESQSEFNIELYDLNGRLLQTIHQGSLLAGNHQFRIAQPVAAAKGIYLLRLYNGKEQHTEKLIFQ